MAAHVPMVINLTNDKKLQVFISPGLADAVTGDEIDAFHVIGSPVGEDPRGITCKTHIFFVLFFL